MSAAFMGADRARPDSDDLQEVAKGVNFDAFNAYAGPFEVKEDRVFHYVEVSSLPQWQGTTQERIDATVWPLRDSCLPPTVWSLASVGSQWHDR